MCVKSTTLLILLLFPIAAFALIAKDGDVISGFRWDETIIIPNNASVTLSYAFIGEGIICEGNATITIVDSNIVRGDYAGIQIGGEGTTLTIKGDGLLLVDGDVGIGMGMTEADAKGGDIVIEGGTITAGASSTDGGWNAGIGTTKSDAKLSMGSISIKGGSVIARGGYWDESTPEEYCVGLGMSYGDENDAIGPIVIYDDVDMLDVYGSKENLAFVHDGSSVVSDSDMDKYFNIVEKIDNRGFHHTIYYSRKKDRFITISNYVEHGSIEASTLTAKAGDKVSLTSVPDEGYSVFWRVYDEKGDLVEVADDSFIMPASNVIVNAVFVLESTPIIFAKIKENITATDGSILIDSTREGVTIVDGAHVTLAGLSLSYATYGIVCEGNATITLLGKNVVNNFFGPGIQIGGPGTTLTIKGDGFLGIGTTFMLNLDGSLDLNTNIDGSAGIGLSGVYKKNMAGGDIVIEGGNISIVGGTGDFVGGAGIGTGYVFDGSASIGSITIKGGSLKVDGGFGEARKEFASGIGKGGVWENEVISVGPIIIYHGVEKVDVSSISEEVTYKFANGDDMDNPSEYFSIEKENSRQVIRSLYPVHIVANSALGTVTAKVASTTGKAAVGENVSLVVTPNIDCNLKTLTVTDAAGKEIKLVNDSFVMPLGEVTVSATFVPKYPTLMFSENRQSVTINGQYDGNDTLKITEPILVYNVEYLRNFTTDGYSTIVLPFDVYTNKLTGVDSILSFGGIVPHEGKKAVGMNVVWERDSGRVKLQANTPYMLKMNESTLGIRGPVTLVPTEAAVTAVDGWEFRGTYVYTAWPEGDEDLCRVYGFAGSSNDDVGVGEFVKFGAGSWLRPLRAYLINTNVTCDSKVRPAGAAARPVMASIKEELPDQMDVIILGDGAESEEHTTVIGRIDTRTGEFKMLRNYDLKGRSVQGKAKARGAYYGKKVLNK